MGSISCHITPLVTNSLWGRDTHTYTQANTHIHTHADNPHRINFKKPGWLARTWFKKWYPYQQDLIIIEERVSIMSNRLVQN